MVDGSIDVPITANDVAPPGDTDFQPVKEFELVGISGVRIYNSCPKMSCTHKALTEELFCSKCEETLSIDAAVVWGVAKLACMTSSRLKNSNW